MALIPGSPCYPRWGSLSGTWRSYTHSWRAFRSPVLVPQAAADAGNGGWMTQGVPEAVAAAHLVSAAGGWAAPGIPTPETITVVGDAAGWIKAAGSASKAAIVSAGSEGILRASGLALYSAGFIVDAEGSALHSIVAAAPRMSRLRLSWRI